MSLNKTSYLEQLALEGLVVPSQRQYLPAGSMEELRESAELGPWMLRSAHPQEGRFPGGTFDSETLHGALTKEAVEAALQRMLEKARPQNNIAVQRAAIRGYSPEEMGCYINKKVDGVNVGAVPTTDGGYFIYTGNTGDTFYHVPSNGLAQKLGFLAGIHSRANQSLASARLDRRFSEWMASNSRALGVDLQTANGCLGGEPKLYELILQKGSARPIFVQGEEAAPVDLSTRGRAASYLPEGESLTSYLGLYEYRNPSSSIRWGFFSFDPFPGNLTAPIFILDDARQDLEAYYSSLFEQASKVRNHILVVLTSKNSEELTPVSAWLKAQLERNAGAVVRAAYGASVNGKEGSHHTVIGRQGPGQLTILHDELARDHQRSNSWQTAFRSGGGGQEAVFKNGELLTVFVGSQENEVCAGFAWTDEQAERLCEAGINPAGEGMKV